MQIVSFCMKCLSLFSEKSKQTITDLLSTELAQRVGNVNTADDT